MEFSINMKLQIGDNLRTVYTAQLVYLNCQDVCCDSLHRMMSSGWIKNSKTDVDHQNIKIFAIPILCNTYVQLKTKLEWMYNKNIIKMHLKKVPTFKKDLNSCLSSLQANCFHWACRSQFYCIFIKFYIIINLSYSHFPRVEGSSAQEEIFLKHFKFCHC